MRFLFQLLYIQNALEAKKSLNKYTETNIMCSVIEVMWVWRGQTVRFRLVDVVYSKMGALSLGRDGKAWGHP